MGVGTVGERQSAGCNRSGQSIRFLKEFLDLRLQTIDLLSTINVFHCEYLFRFVFLTFRYQNACTVTHFRQTTIEFLKEFIDLRLQTTELPRKIEIVRRKY